MPNLAHVSSSTAKRLVEAGFPDLVSVIPPGATISPNSRVDPSQRGKCPGLRGADGAWYGYDFTKKAALPAQIDASGANIGIMGDRFPALDIDSESEALTKVVLARAQKELGVAPVRLSRGHRRLLMYRTDSPFRKIALDIWYGDEKHTIEFLGEKRQYLVHGEHPSGEQYRWEGDAPWDMNPNDLPPITEEDARGFLTRLRDDLRAKGIEADFQGSRERTTEPPPPQEDLEAPNLEQLEAVVADIPNDDSFADRDDYIRMGHAIKAAGGEEALYIFMEWCDRWEDGFNDPETVEADWSRMQAPYRIGYDYLLGKAGPKRAQWRAEAAGRCFDLDSKPPSPADPHVASELRGLLALSHGLAGPWPDVLEVLDTLYERLDELDARERVILEAAMVEQLRPRVGGSQAARQVLESLAPRRETGAFRRGDDGRAYIQPLTAEHLSTEAHFLVDGLIPAAAVGAVISGYSMGKTWLVVDLGLSIAFGQSWMGQPVDIKPVIFLIAEGNQAFPMRIYGWLVDRGYLEQGASLEEMFELLEGRVVINRYPAHFDEPEFEEALTATIEGIGAGLAIIDTLGKTLGPKQPENDNDVANEVTGMLSGIASRTGCGVLLTHHVGISNSDRARGASAWEQGLDFAFLIKGSRPDFDAGRAVTLRCTKMRDAPKPKPIHYRLKKLPGLALRRHDGLPPSTVRSAVIERSSEAQPSLAPLTTRVFEFIDQNPGASQQAICSAVTGGSNPVRAAIQQLADSRAIENVGSSRRHEWKTVEGVQLDARGEVSRPQDVFELEEPTEADGEG